MLIGHKDKNNILTLPNIFHFFYVTPFYLYLKISITPKLGHCLSQRRYSTAEFFAYICKIPNVDKHVSK